MLINIFQKWVIYLTNQELIRKQINPKNSDDLKPSRAKNEFLDKFYPVNSDSVIPECMKKNNREYVTKIHTLTMNDIRKLPYLCFKEFHNGTTVEGYIRSCTTNKLLEDLVREGEFNLYDDRKGFGVFDHVLSRDWVKYYRMLFEFKLDHSNFFMDLPACCLHLTGKNGLQLNGRFNVLKNVYYQDNMLIYEIYYVFVDDEIASGSEVQKREA